MDRNEELRALLHRYYDAETTDAEEERLRAMLEADGLPAEFDADKRMFRALRTPEPAAPQGMDDRLARRIDAWNRVEKTTLRRARTISLRWIAGVAAALVILFTGAYIYNVKAEQALTASRQDAITDPDKAYAEAEQSLMKFSRALNKGLHTIDNATGKKQ